MRWTSSLLKVKVHLHIHGCGGKLAQSVVLPLRLRTYHVSFQLKVNLKYSCLASELNHALTCTGNSGVIKRRRVDSDLRYVLPHAFYRWEVWVGGNRDYPFTDQGHLLNIKSPHFNSEVTYKCSTIFRITSECFLKQHWQIYFRNVKSIYFLCDWKWNFVQGACVTCRVERKNKSGRNSSEMAFNTCFLKW